MVKSNGLIAVLPYSRFKWTAEIQYKESLFTQEEAIRFASQHGCNVIVKYEKRSGPLFDVLQDPNLVCTSEDGYETVEAIPVAELESTGPSKRALRGVAGLIKWFGAAASPSHPEKAIPKAHTQPLVVK